MYLLNICIENNLKLYYLINHIPVEKYLKLKYSKFYINKEITPETLKIYQLEDFKNLKDDNYYTFHVSLLYDSFNYDLLQYKLDDIFYFTNEIIDNCISNLNYDNYISIHLRLGDLYLETDKKYICCIDDSRKYDIELIDKFIENYSHKKIIFFCDNNTFKLKMKEKYNYLIITNFEIGHTDLINTTDKQVLDTITEFYILSNSEHIFYASNSGFPIMASKFKNIPLSKI